ncbi:hypothetical protein PILCRDRAFT_379 [Piloderma croceum F 1598]|uniref:Uncharacterized protein n=1 Tax=Piloderma croceum (strain F 1598) TaxID=765440 RepID=A0A0C3G7U6_PILCF|nr:hypothetical protein PILCRDRAFT_379 [Piloderma croceum F 1598]
MANFFLYYFVIHSSNFGAVYVSKNWSHHSNTNSIFFGLGQARLSDSIRRPDSKGRVHAAVRPFTRGGQEQDYDKQERREAGEEECMTALGWR